MEKLFRRTLAAATVVTVVAACGDETIVFPGGPAGPAIEIDITGSLIELRAGETVTIGMQGRDAAGNPTAGAPTIASADGSVVSATAGAGTDQWVATATLTGGGLGETTVTVTLGSLTQDIVVRVGPGSMTITGDPIVGFDVLGTAADNTFSFGVSQFDLAGASLTGTIALEWSTDDDDLLQVNPATGELVTLGLGTANLFVRAPGGASAAVPITIGAPLLDGSANVVTGTQGFLVTVTRNAGEDDFDANTIAFFDFGRVQAFVDAFSASTITVAIPATGVAGRQDIVFRNVGANDVDKRVIFDVTDASTDDRWAGNSSGASAPDFDASASPAGSVYFTFAGQGVIYGGSSPDDWFAISAGATPRTVTITFEWLGVNGSADADLFLCSAPGGAAGCGAVAASQDYNPPEPPIETLTGVTIPANTTYYIVAVNFSDQGSDYSNGRINVQ